MNKKLLEFIGIGLITGALVWGLVQASGVQVNLLPTISYDGATDTVTDSSNLFQLNRGGLNADSEMRIYESFVDASNYERFEAETGANSINLVARSAGTGSQLTMNLGTLGGSALNLISNNATGLTFNTGGTEATFNFVQGNADDGLTLGVAAATWAATSNFQTITGDAGGNTVTTITGGTTGQTLTILFADADVTITDDNAHTANTVDLSAAFISTPDATLTLLSNGTSWYEKSRSVN